MSRAIKANTARKSCKLELVPRSEQNPRLAGDLIVAFPAGRPASGTRLQRFLGRVYEPFEANGFDGIGIPLPESAILILSLNADSRLACWAGVHPVTRTPLRDAEQKRVVARPVRRPQCVMVDVRCTVAPVRALVPPRAWQDRGARVGNTDYILQRVGRNENASVILSDRVGSY